MVDNGDDLPNRNAIFQNFLDKYGEPNNHTPLDIANFSSSESTMPEKLRIFWASNGFGSYANGLIWTHPPILFEDLIEEWTGLLSNEATFIFRTSFGDFCFWCAEGAYLVNTQLGQLEKLASNIDFLFDYILCREQFLRDVLRLELHCQSVEKLGLINVDECYGFVPVRALGGAGELETVERVTMREYLALLAQVVGPISIL
jgi:hypothetical protein